MYRLRHLKGVGSLWRKAALHSGWSALAKDSRPPLPLMLLATLSPIDYGVILLYLAAMLAVGFYFSRRQTGLAEFFLGSRSLGSLPVRQCAFGRRLHGRLTL